MVLVTGTQIVKKISAEPYLIKESAEFKASKPFFMAALTDSEFNIVQKLIADNLGVTLTAESKPFLISRLQNLLYENGFGSFGEYYEHVVTDPTGQVLNKLVDNLSPHHSYFNRGPEHFQLFQRKILPKLTEEIRYRGPQKLRIWSAGCSTGEEPYLIAILLLEYFGSELDAWDVTVLASDNSEQILSSAVSGIFTADDLAKLPPNLRGNYFTRVSESNWIAKPELKHLIRFRVQDLIQTEKEFGEKFHVIFCRNVMTFFDEPTRKAVLRRLFRHTLAGGYLFVGLSECFGPFDAGFKYVGRGVYQRETQSA